MAITQEKFKKYVQVGCAAAICILVSPIIFLAVKGMIGILIAGAVGAVALALMPAFSEAMTALKFKATSFVISRAPVEALYQRDKERTEALIEQRNLLSEQAGNLERFKTKTTAFVKKYPDEAPARLAQLAGYEKLFSYRVGKYKEAKAAQAEFAKAVDKAEDIYEMAVADAQLGKAFNKDTDFMATFREKTAFDAIDKASSSALANLRMALVDDDFATKAVENTAEPVRAVAYDAQGSVVLGDILSEIPVSVRQTQAQTR